MTFASNNGPFLLDLCCEMRNKANFTAIFILKIEKICHSKFFSVKFALLFAEIFAT